MKYLKVFTITIISLSMIHTSCSSKSNHNIKADTMGGSCSYTRFEGYAKIRSITPAPVSEYNCPYKPMQILFEFTPVNISDRQKYRFTNFSDAKVSMQINDGANPSLTWVEKNKITSGKKLRCFRTELLNGTCTPVIFTFPDLNLYPETGCK